ncbi:hypothetical protein Bhyg_03451 [Pseudolycoriella hygida]|uniref:Uncharacterized protein n=1 Tax=Pseudolycoriella hygida TaxID=35572 RepID=A0A9Q0NDF6_9DIPT|nr:hypothetical protein Bhyg_03451 [Pseudolycoriella hygida]
MLASDFGDGLTPTAPISVISNPPTGRSNGNAEGEISTMDALLLGRTRWQSAKDLYETKL